MLSIGGKDYPAELVEATYAEKAGFDKIYAVNALPPIFIDALVRAAQVCAVPHTWRVKEYQTEAEVPPDIVRQGRVVLEKDQTALGAHIITYMGEQNGEQIFLAAGAIRDHLTRDFHNPLFPVVSRAVVAPAWRGKGLGKMIVEHRFKAVLNYFGHMPNAIHFATENERILKAIKHVERDTELRFVHIGNETYAAADGVYSVSDYLCFLPEYQRVLLKACDVLAKPVPLTAEFKASLKLFMANGIEVIKGSTLEQQFYTVREAAKKLSSADVTIQPALQTIAEFFTVKTKIGAVYP